MHVRVVQNSACFIGADQIATGGQDGNVRLWQASQSFPCTVAPVLQHTFERHKKPVMNVSIHPTRSWVSPNYSSTSLALLSCNHAITHPSIYV